MEHRIKTQKTARYFTYGHDIEAADAIWFVLHGYGQLAKFFIRRFEVLDPARHFVIAPEGLHRFYTEGFSGRVGASWMTKESRLDDIGDYVAYLNQVYRETAEAAGAKRIIGLGFSQGVATLVRWLAMGGKHFDAAVLWAGSFPPDLDTVDAERTFNGLNVFALAGDEDPFINEESLNRTKAHLEALKLNVPWKHYHGGHTILPEPLLSLASEIETRWVRP